MMQALFIGQTYIDVTFVADRIPIGDEKDVAKDYAISFGGNAVTAAFCCAKLGIAPDLLCSLADDWLGRMFLDMACKYKVADSSPQGAPLVAVLRHAARQHARHPAHARRRLSAPLSAAESRRLPRRCISTATRRTRRCIMPRRAVKLAF